ncbi:hypothetical protein [Tateyamaria sp. Alg231-49]|uniref:hypothetical protein n=1 Tax=Tateyamaria sp. Alg231-49 TaxID=1922219 RepID=UPI000D55EA83|nr:hypothetical protein [Tateyamaria sp. Alg231-49]
MKAPRAFANLTLLTSGLTFLTLVGKDIRYFQWWYPLALAVALTAKRALETTNNTSATLVSSSFVSDVSSAGFVLIGFFLAALSAVVAFPGRALDDTIQGAGVFHRAEIVTRRKMLAALFGYCILLSAFLISPNGVFDLFQILLNSISYLTSYVWVLDWAQYFGFMFISCSLVVSSLLGLHYLVNYFSD